MAKHNPMVPGNLFAELKCRCNLSKIAAAYVVVGWLIAQIKPSNCCLAMTWLLGSVQLEPPH